MPTDTSASDRGEDPLYAALAAHTGRKLSMGEVYEAVGLGSSQYNDLRKTGKLVNADRVISAAEYFGLNPVELLAACGIIAPADAVAYVDEKREAAAAFLGEATGPTVLTKQGVTTTRQGRPSLKGARAIRGM